MTGNWFCIGRRGRGGSLDVAALPQPLARRDTVAREKFGHRRSLPRLHIPATPALLMQAATLALNGSVTQATRRDAFLLFTRYKCPCVHPPLTPALSSIHPLHDTHTDTPTTFLIQHVRPQAWYVLLCLHRLKSSPLTIDFRWTQGTRAVRQDHSTSLKAVLRPRPRPC